MNMDKVKLDSTSQVKLSSIPPGLTCEMHEGARINTRYVGEKRVLLISLRCSDVTQATFPGVEWAGEAGDVVPHTTYIIHATLFVLK